MKNKAKLLLGKLTLIIILLLNVNCEKDEDQRLNEKVQTTNALETLSIDELKSFDDFKNTITSFNANTIIAGEENTLAGKSSNGIMVNTESVIKFKKENYTSYTFALTKKDGNNETFDNLVIEKKGDTIQGFIIRYKYSKKSLEYLSLGINIPFEGTVQRTAYAQDIDKLLEKYTSKNTSHTASKTQVCNTMTVIRPYRCGGPGRHLPGDNRCGWKLGLHSPPGYSISSSIHCYDTPDTGLGHEEEVIDFIADDIFGGGSGSNTVVNNPVDDKTEELIAKISKKLSLFKEHEIFLKDNKDVLVAIANFLEKNNNVEGEKFAKNALQVLIKGNAKEKEIAKALLNGNEEAAMNLLLEGASYSNNQCPNPPCENFYFDAPVQLTASLIISTSDGINNALLLGEEFLLSGFKFHKESRGKTIKRIIEKSGVDLPEDIDLAALSNLFKLRMRGAEMVVEKSNDNIFELFNDLTISMLDVSSMISPSKQVGAYLFVKTGGNVTTKAIADYLKVIKKGRWETVSESMSDAAKSYQEFISGRRWNESFVLGPKNTKFDGIKDGLLVDAKSGHLNFVDKSTGRFKDFFTGGGAAIKQADNQLKAAEGLPVEWHFEHKIVRDAFEYLFRFEEFTNLKLIHTPRN